MLTWGFSTYFCGLWMGEWNLAFAFLWDKLAWHSSSFPYLIYPCVKNDGCFYKLLLFQDFWSSVLIISFDRNESLDFFFSFLLVLWNQNHLERAVLICCVPIPVVLLENKPCLSMKSLVCEENCPGGQKTE